MASHQVLVTLIEPYLYDKDGQEIPLVLRYGHDDSRALMAPSMLNVGGVQVDMSDFVDAGAFQSEAPRMIPTTIPGKYHEFLLEANNPEQNSIIMPIEAASMYFGNPFIPRMTQPGTDPVLTFGYERNRVASLWGWYEMPQVSLKGLSHCTKGENDFDLRKIGPPKVPHVLIQHIDNRGRVTGKLTFDPWEHFRWQDDVEKIAPAQPQFAGSSTALLEASIAMLHAEIQALKSKKQGRAPQESSRNQ